MLLYNVYSPGMFQMVICPTNSLTEFDFYHRQTIPQTVAFEWCRGNSFKKMLTITYGSRVLTTIVDCTVYQSRRLQSFLVYQNGVQTPTAAYVRGFVNVELFGWLESFVILLVPRRETCILKRRMLMRTGKLKVSHIMNLVKTFWLGEFRWWNKNKYKKNNQHWARK